MISFDAEPEAYLEYIKQIVSVTAAEIDHGNFVKMLFLFSDVLSKEEHDLWIHSSDTCAKKIFSLIQLVLKRKNLNVTFFGNVLAELFFLTKNYWLLRHLKTCKHHFKQTIVNGNTFCCSEFLRFLLSLGYDLADEEVNYIWQRLENGIDICLSQPEFLFRWMISNNIISDRNIDALSKHFKVLKRGDLLCKTEDYINKQEMLSSSILYDVDCTKPGAPCGLALIFNNKTFKKDPDKMFAPFAEKKLADRPGTDEDARSLKELWSSFGIQADVHNDTSRVEFETLLNKSLSQDLSAVKIFIICILSHGDNGVFFSSDRVPYWIADVEMLLGMCDGLAGKPKLLFIQACQGTVAQIKEGAGALANRFELDVSKEKNDEPHPQYSDMLIGMATVPNFVSLRRPGTGTHFIQTVVDVLQAKGHKHDLSMLVREINFEVANKWATYFHEKTQQRLTVVQMPSFCNQLRRGLIFKRAPQNL